METVLNQVEQKYPAAAEQLSQLPPHLIEQVGETALGLSHTDMHPAETVKDQFGREFQKIDFSRVITDPELDIQDLNQETVEAAQAGEQKLAGVLGTSSALLKDAHKNLVEQGVVFGEKAVETDEARTERETQEREAIYKEALNMALESAKKAKAEGREDIELQLLESLILLSYIRPAEDRVLLRRVVREDLAEGLVKAGQESAKLFVDDEYKGVADRLRKSRFLLEFATGQKLDYDFNPTGKLDLTTPAPIPFFDDIQDILAVVTMPDSPISLQQAIDYLPNATAMIEIKKRFSSSPEKANEVLWGLSELDESRDMIEALKCADPVLAQQTAKKLGLELWEVKALFGVETQSTSDPVELNVAQIEGMVELRTLFPGHFDEIKDHVIRSVGPLRASFNPKDIVHGLDELQTLGLDTPEFIIGLCDIRSAEKYIKACNQIAEELKKRGINLDQLDDLLTKNHTHELPKHQDVYNLVMNSIVEGSATEIIEKLIVNAEIVDYYVKAYSDIQYPLTTFKNLIKSPELSDLPAVEERLLRLGLPRDVAEEMLASWTTHEAYIRNFYSSEEDKFSLPKEAPDQEVLAKLAKQQSDALQFQLDSIEAYEKAYGQESLNEIINNFGIYNFGRYRQLELYEQNQRWLSGEPVGSVVVNARFDWNSYTGKNPVFQDEQGKGVFIFEANSGTETARIAVRVGQRERQQGRQPDVKRFIVHAHGNEDGMTIGTSGESIDTRMYRQAARDRTKIPGSEVNDYKKHLGENFEVILQSCSTAGENVGPNIATVMSEGHDVKVTASSVTISGLIIRSDGSVQFSTGLANTEPVIIQPTD